MEWQPIETAPSMKSVLIAGGTFNTDDCDYEDMEFNGVKVAFKDNQGRWNGGYGEGYNVEYWHLPTHWMPLPEPPK